MDIVTTFGVIQCLGIVSHGAEAAGFVGLLQDGSCGVLGSIDFKGVGVVGVWLLEDGIAQHNLFEPLNGCGASWGPSEGYVLLCKFGERFGNIGKAADKGALVTEHPKCAVDLFYSTKLFWPSGQTIAFCGVNTDGTIADDYAQVFYGGMFKFAFGGFEEETLSGQKVEDIVDDASVEGQVVVRGDEDIIHIDKQHAWVLVLQGAE
jgi:hypothetical protein